MKISIITVTKNNKPGLLRAIECVRDQTYKNIEHIIVDGGSTDGTKEMMEDGRWMREDVKFRSEADSGIYDAINKGIKLATGDVIGLLHSDDLYADENVLAKYAEVFKLRAEGKEQSAVEVVYSDLVYVRQKSQAKADQPPAEKVQSPKSDSGRAGMTKPRTSHYSLLTYLPDRQATDYSVIRYWRSHAKSVDSGSVSGMTTSGYLPLITDNRLLVTDHLLNKGWMPPHPTLFVKKEIFEKYGYYRTDMKIAADYEMILRLLYKHKITSYYLPLTTYLMSIGGASNKSLKNILQKSKEDFRGMKINGIKFPALTLISKNLRKLPQFLARDLS